MDTIRRDDISPPVIFLYSSTLRAASVRRSFGGTMQATLRDAAWSSLATLGARIPVPTAAIAVGHTPVHTLYGGAHLFKSTTVARLGQLAVAHLAQYAPDAAALSTALGWQRHPEDAQRYDRLVRKLADTPVEDLRIDFEDGYGERGDADEDAQAVRVGEQVAIAWQQATMPRSFGLRIKALSGRHWQRGARTLDLFCTTLARSCALLDQGVPKQVLVTVPKVEHVSQVVLAVALATQLEQSLGWPSGTLGLELMVESPQALCDGRGIMPLGALVAAAQGRCRGVHLGAYDYLAACQVTAVSGGLRHPACDLARGLMRLALAGTEVRLADGATQVLPLPRHAPAHTPHEQQENAAVIHAAWRLHADNVTHALHQGFYQGWDLHPAQLIPRYAAVYRFFRDHLPVSCQRMQAFLDQAATASTVGEYFDDAASALGLMHFFRQGLACGALTAADTAPVGLRPEAFVQPHLQALVGLRQTFPP